MTQVRAHAHADDLQDPPSRRATLRTVLGDRFYRATAPSAALPTSLAYFWIATSTRSFARAGGV